MAPQWWDDGRHLYAPDDWTYNDNLIWMVGLMPVVITAIVAALAFLAACA